MPLEVVDTPRPSLYDYEALHTIYEISKEEADLQYAFVGHECIINAFFALIINAKKYQSLMHFQCNNVFFAAETQRAGADESEEGDASLSNGARYSRENWQPAQRCKIELCYR